MTPLHEILLRQIARVGPISVADFMTQALLHPDHGYYTTTTPIGRGGDFVTAPEISQMFGELIGLSLAQAWLDQGSPAPFHLCEIGPGKGTLMGDILRATKSVPNFHAAMNVILIEASPTLQAVQKQTLSGFDVTWLDSVAALPDGPLFMVANEFFDCLPIRQYRRNDTGWQEQMIGAENDAFHFVLGTQSPADLFRTRADLPTGAIIETSTAGNAIMDTISRHIANFGGAFIALDYGDWGTHGDTFQAIKNHEKSDPLLDVGCADLTAHVDFHALGETAKTHAKISQLTPQGVLLERLGITARAQQLAAKLSGDALENHIAAHKRLTHPSEMGTLFKALAVVPHNAPLPAGFEG
ncbi:methyltransferase [Amylibacter kogurei]|uniref:Methyltransferase n=1 Tax=Paramylibacter kogurei TaxID=1889778 RepID=A0A2G5K2Y4_9RHOB|nr:SAM-dependent methyltransferase [Amylibacter kogurei]PIB23479.1 methyltransferase [Amylibacter kogurei]